MYYQSGKADGVDWLTSNRKTLMSERQFTFFTSEVTYGESEQNQIHRPKK